MKCLRLFFVLLVLLFWGCTDDSSFAIRTVEVDSQLDESHDGLVRIFAHNAFVVMGTDDKKAPYVERPQMLTRFDYDFSIGKHEVTFGEFYKYATDVWGQFSYNVLENHPITDLTYFDAVLYANARSKAEGFDTAYTYSAAAFDEDGRCSKLEALIFHPDVDAYRLPTEAEWLLVASQEWDLEKAWTSENSSSVIHEVCTKGESKVGVCDIAGNALEWVNDWLGLFKDTVVYNYAGAADGGLLGQRVVKGGSFNASRETATLHSRGDVYTVTSSSRGIYLGFRIAFGKIPDALWMNNEGVSVDERLIPKISAGKIRTLTGTIRSKLVFRNDVTGNLAFVDYAYAPHMVIQIEDTLDCYHPDISPNGSLIAFSTGTEGIEGKSSVYVRTLSVSGEGLVKLNVENASIPRWRILPDGDTVIVYVTDAGDNTDKSEFSKKSTWQVPFKEMKFGKPQKLFDGAYHGGISWDNKLAVSGARLLRARMADSTGSILDATAKDTVWYGGEQACNVSMVADSSKRTLFLDFGTEDYGVHERILIADSTGKTIASFASPKGYAFDHTEWVVGGYLTHRTGNQNFIVSTLTNANGVHEKIVLLNLADSVITDLVDGTEMWHPAFWVDRSFVINDSLVVALEADSAAIYYESVDSPLLASKMNVFWAKSDYLKVIGLGSSRMSLGFVANRISVGATFNMATIPSDMDVSRYLALNYALNHCKKLKYLVVGLDLDLWSDSPGTNVKKNIVSIPGFHYDRNHDFWVEEGNYAMKKISNSFLPQIPHLRHMSTHMGWVEYNEKFSWNEGHFGHDALVSDSNWSNNSKFIDDGISQLTDIVVRAAEKNVMVLGVIFPQSPHYKKTGAFGRHGMRRSHAEKVIEHFKEMEKEYSNFFMLDENKMGYHDYPDSMAYDYDHLNMYGGYQITSRIDSALKAIGGK